MANSSAYTVWLTLAVQHSYFLNKKQCGLDIEPDQETRYLLDKQGIIFRKMDACTWVLIRPADLTDIEAAGFTFHLKNTSNQFYYYTSSTVTVNHGVCQDVQKKGIWKQLDITAASLTFTPLLISIGLESPAKFLEFIVIPRRIGSDVKLEVRDEKGELDFIPMEKINFPSEQQEVFRFVTQKTVLLKESVVCRLRLWQIHTNGESILSESLKMPQASSVSLFAPTDTITSYIYV